MELAWTPIAGTDAHHVWQGLLRQLGAELAGMADEVAGRAVESYRSSVPELFADVQTVQELGVSTAANIRDFGELVERGIDPRTMQLPSATVVVARSSVQRGVGLAPLLRCYQLGHEIVWRWLFARITESSSGHDELATAATAASAWLFAFVDEATDQLTDVYEKELEQWLASAIAERAETIGAILSGRERDTVHASRKLRYDLERQHIGVYAWFTAGPAEPDSQAQLNQTIRELAARTDAISTLTIPLGSLAARAWLTRPGTFTEKHLQRLAEWRSNGNVRISMGSPGAGLDGFRRTQLEAEHARRFAALVREAPVTCYQDVAIAAMATADMEQASFFVHRVLGPLAESSETMMRVSETLAVFLDENGSRSRAATRLHIHGNTVNYRVRQAEQMLHRDLNHNTLDLQVALAILPAVRG
ncbi:CdaR family transcriptional regulator [Nocardia sp. CNY236]|uniref:PucR family transcriptional regulator n=1 Tax=Nocardia sp. CNY236 TaxID=1169152 RepID=UPI0003FDB623|nr:helix-turn-helix domain-containing protein [Nocardia sp. CNY236]